MHTISSAVRRHPLVTFFGLAYGISYGFYALSALVPGFPFLFPFGSIIAAAITASIGGGLQGLIDLLRRCLRWRVGLRWYAAALLVPISIALVVVALNTFGGAPMPSAAQLGPWYSLLLLFPMALFDAPLQENSGWHGYAMPRFSADHSPLANTLILGLLLAGWHAPLTLEQPSIIVPYLLTTVASAVVTNWVYYNARQSALLAILYHTAANTMGIYFRPTLSGSDLTRYFWLLLAVNCVVAVAVVVFDRNTWRSESPMAPQRIETARSVS